MKPALAAAALRSVGWAGACTRRLDGLCWLSACFGLVTQLTNGFLLAGRRVPSLLGLAPLFSPGLLSLDQGVVLCQRSGRNMGQPFPAPPGSRLCSCQRKCPWSLLPKPQKAAWPRPRRGWLSSLGRSHTRCWWRNDGTTLFFRCARSPSGSVFHLWG